MKRRTTSTSPATARPTAGSPTRPDAWGSLRRLLVGALERRRALIDSGRTRCFRAFAGEADGIDGLFIDVYGEGATLIVYEGRTPRGFDAVREAETTLGVLKSLGVRGVYLKPFAKDRSKLGGSLPPVVTDPTPAAGIAVSEALVVREVEWKLEVRLFDGLSTGIFLDQRENRAFVRDWCAERAKHGERVSALNTFAYTCAFSAAAAKGGAATTSVDVSGRYLDWGKRNLMLNGFEVVGREAGGKTAEKTPSSAASKHAAPSPAEPGEGGSSHRFARMDTFEFFRYAVRKGLKYGLIVLDPPSFAAGSKKDKVEPWSSVEGYARLVAEAVLLLEEGGLVLASTNTVELCRDGGKPLQREIVKGLGGRKPRWAALPPPPLDFAGERNRFAARAFTL